MSVLYKIPESILVIIYTVDLHVLLIERIEKNYWQSVTGSKNTLSEPLYIAAQREIQEETGISVVGYVDSIKKIFKFPRYFYLQNWHFSTVYKIYSRWRYRYAPNVIYNIEHVFSLLVPRTVQITLSPHEHIKYQWLPYYKAAALCFSPSNASAILKLPYYSF